MWLSKSHPITVIAVFLAVSFGAAAIYAGIISHVTRPKQSYLDSLRECLAATWNPGDLMERSGQSVAYYSIGVLGTITAVLLPTFLLGAFVFKILRHDPLVWRTTFTVAQDRQGYPILKFKFYNATSSDIVGVRIEIIARRQVTRKPAMIYNYVLDVLPEDLDASPVAFRPWTYGRRGAPYTTSVALGGPIRSRDLRESSTMYVPIIDMIVPKTDLSFLVIAQGTIVETGNSFASVKEYSAATGAQFEPAQSIDADYSKPPRQWSGWENFDGITRSFVFAYASLANVKSIAAAMKHPVRQEQLALATISGWTRVWSVARIATPSSTRIPRSNNPIVTLGLSKGNKTDHCIGVILRISDEDLMRLDENEEHFVRVDVSADVSFEGKPSGCLVYTYVPNPKSVEFLEEALRTPGTPIISAEYLDHVVTAFATMGAVSEFWATTPATPYPVRRVGREEFGYE